jgi:hypothetical protein
MTRLDASQLAFLEEQCSKYQKAADQGALSYLAGREVPPEAADSFRLGLVLDAPPEHHKYEGMLSIPILKRGVVQGMRFRCIQEACKVNTREEDHDGHPKFRSMPGARTWLYGTDAVLRPTDELELTEGEPDAWILSGVLGLAAVAIPGVDTWKANPWWSLLFEGHRKIRMWADPDKAGARLAEQVAKDLGPKVTIVDLPDDVSWTYRDHGVGALIEAGGL